MTNNIQYLHLFVSGPHFQYSFELRILDIPIQIPQPEKHYPTEIQNIF